MEESSFIKKVLKKGGTLLKTLAPFISASKQEILEALPSLIKVEQGIPFVGIIICIPCCGYRLYKKEWLMAIAELGIGIMSLCPAAMPLSVAASATLAAADLKGVSK